WRRPTTPANRPKVRQKHRDQNTQDKRPPAATDYQKDRAKQRRDRSRLKPPQLVRRADEHPVDRRNPAAHFVWGKDCRQRVTHDDADVIERAGQSEGRRVGKEYGWGWPEREERNRT